ncbi:Uu.00g087700.m01.CDS01 [Anthostomella pinea]|uniref:Uu.00g087700.m01.CDS01 n=1 Tax=Anthostomella pinea TaxID=933095 RepID=A0AAI8VMD3_9PEZI|nr:Uu.00g087700.m01.CDS01 [Anthostomella pinea]
MGDQTNQTQSPSGQEGRRLDRIAEQVDWFMSPRTPPVPKTKRYSFVPTESEEPSIPNAAQDQWMRAKEKALEIANEEAGRPQDPQDHWLRAKEKVLESVRHAREVRIKALKKPLTDAWRKPLSIPESIPENQEVHVSDQPKSGADSRN